MIAKLLVSCNIISHKVVRFSLKGMYVTQSIYCSWILGLYHKLLNFRLNFCAVLGCRPVPYGSFELSTTHFRKVTVHLSTIEVCSKAPAPRPAKPKGIQRRVRDSARFWAG